MKSPTTKLGTRLIMQLQPSPIIRKAGAFPVLRDVQRRRRRHESRQKIYSAVEGAQDWQGDTPGEQGQEVLSAHGGPPRPIPLKQIRRSEENEDETREKDCKESKELERIRIHGGQREQESVRIWEGIGRDSI